MTTKKTTTEPHAHPERRARHAVRGVLCVLLACLTGCAGIGSRDGLLYVELGTADLQTQLEQGFPLKRCAMQVACAKFTEPRLQLSEGANRIYFGSALAIELGVLRWPGQIALSGTPRYDARSGSFYLESLRVERIAFDGLNTELADWIRGNAGPFLQPVFDTHPIYTIDETSMRGALLRRSLRGVSVEQGRLRATFAFTPAAVPAPGS